MTASIADIWTGTGQGLWIAAPGSTLGPRRRECYEMLWIQSGSGVFTLDTSKDTVPAGAMILVPPARREFCRWDAKDITRVAYFHFHLAAVPPDWPDPLRWPRVRRVEPRDLATSLFEFVQSHAPATPNSGVSPTLARAVEALLSVHILGPAELRPPLGPTPPEPVYRAIHFILEVMQSDPSLPVSLSDLADASGVTAKHLCRLFKQSLQCSPVEAVWIYRLTLSLLFLRDPQRKISDIAQNLGFANPFHYSKRFRDYFGEPPRTMRQKMLTTGYEPPLPPWPFM